MLRSLWEGAKMSQNIHTIVINNKSFGEFDGTKIFVTDDLYETLAKRKTRDGRTLLKLLEIGRAVQGLKHLIATVEASNKNGKIILNSDKTKRVGDNYFINLNEYITKGRNRFFALYKETGFDAALSYLNSQFPKEFKYDKDRIKEADLKKVTKKLPEVLSRVSKKDLTAIQKQSSLSFYQSRLEELRSRLANDYPETKGKDSWQKWIYANNWLFGTQYLKPIDRQRISYDNIPDFLFPTLDGFLDILEIKKPKLAVIKKDEHHAGAYSWCPETNKAIGQVVNYLREMEQDQLKLMKKINEAYKDEYGITFYTFKPRAFILAGISDTWKPKEKEVFRNLNYSLHGIEVLTYSDLILRGESLISMLSAKHKG
jgi:hypothetical protein